MLRCSSSVCVCAAVLADPPRTPFAAAADDGSNIEPAALRLWCTAACYCIPTTVDLCDKVSHIQGQGRWKDRKFSVHELIIKETGGHVLTSEIAFERRKSGNVAFGSLRRARCINSILAATCSLSPSGCYLLPLSLPPPGTFEPAREAKRQCSGACLCFPP